MIASCKEDEKVLMSTTFNYEFNNGQVVSSAPYMGNHSSDLSASMKVEELENGNTLISVSIFNSLDGEVYHVHAHDAADPTQTPNGTPYNETPNSSLFATSTAGNGGTITLVQETEMSYDEILNSYSGFLVIHDPLQSMSTTDISTYIVLGTFAREQASSNLSSSSYIYDFNTGQLDIAFTYNGTHSNTLKSMITLDQLANNMTRVTVKLMNSISGETYHMHAHDMADPLTTPNGTPYDESPNADVFVSSVLGTGGDATVSTISPMTYSSLTTNYNGFFVVHDPLQNMSTTNPSTYVILGIFAR